MFDAEMVANVEKILHEVNSKTYPDLSPRDLQIAILRRIQDLYDNQEKRDLIDRMIFEMFKEE